MLLRIITLFLAFLPLVSFGQKYDPLHAPNSYQSPANPNYWKNKMPFEGYWQQDVHYTIKANIDETQNIIDGRETLVYTNNSPDTLRQVFFHLYQQAFQPHSYYDKLHREGPNPKTYGAYEREGLGTKVSNLTVNKINVTPEFDNTIMRIPLPIELLPGESISIAMEFKTYFQADGQVRRRMKAFQSSGYQHYDGVHWYPRISVYDRKFGWTTDQHLGKEFYGDFGCFDVELTFASNYVVEATGNMVNRDEVLPDELRQKLDIKKFTNRRYGEPASEVIPYDPSDRKTWIFHAENVHDFAFTADPAYRIGEAEWNGIKCYALVQEPHVNGWLNAAEYTAKIIQTFSEDIGMYTYHKMIVADARDGMEYPMLTLDGGFDPQYRGLLVHEVGHNWFFGQIGTNETYRAFMDEGFTQFLTAWGLEAIDGNTVIKPNYGGHYRQQFKRPVTPQDDEIYTWYMWDAVKGEDPFLNTHSDGFDAHGHSEGGYGHVYYKTATMLYNLQYVLGDELFLSAMQHYFETWKIAHPYPEDFRNTIIRYTKVDLNWFFDQWLETTKTIDYGVKSVRKGRGENEYIVRFERKGEQQMPIDFQVIAKDDSIYNFHIPNTYFVKATDAQVLPKWTGWDELNPTYEATIVIPNGIRDVVIDPTHRLADVYMPDNAKKMLIRYEFDSKIYNTPDWKTYEVKARPEVWWNGYDGVKLGFHINGNYMNYKHQFDLTTWFNTGLGQNLHPDFQNDDGVNNDYDQLSYRFNYRNGIHRLSRRTFIDLHASFMAGLETYKVGFDKELDNDQTEVYFFFKSMVRPDSADLAYLLYPAEWQTRRYNNSANLGVNHRYRYANGRGKINFNVRSSTIGGDYDYAQLALNVTNYNRVGRLRVNTRTVAQYGTGSNTPYESMLFLNGANPEEMMDNKYTRATGFWDHAFFGFGRRTDHFHAGGGLNLRGYNGYLAPYVDENDSVRLAYRGTSGAAVNIEIELQDWVGIRLNRLSRTFALDYYLFADAGIISVNSPTERLMFADLRADAGVGTALTIKRWGPLETAKPLTIRFDVPFFLNRPPAAAGDFVQMRWVVGVNRAF